MSTPAFIYSEQKVADSLGISRTEARAYRSKLKEGRDWKKGGSEILLSNKGLDRLAELCGASLTDGLVQSLAEKKNGAPEKMRVARITDNTRMVYALADGVTGFQLVHVGNNTNFVVGDAIEVGPHPTQNGIWQLISPIPRDRRRLPRR